MDFTIIAKHAKIHMQKHITKKTQNTIDQRQGGGKKIVGLDLNIIFQRNATKTYLESLKVCVGSVRSEKPET